MSQESPESLIEACPTCHALVDVSDQEIFALAHCPMCGTAMRVRYNLNHFELMDVVGVGGMGTVYKALDTKLNRNIAIKLLKPEFGMDRELVEKLEREARITASINHPNVVKVYSFGSAMGKYYLAMELVEKGSLDDLMQIQNRIAEMQVLTVGIQIAEGLNAAYERGLIHSDVKPGNILFSDPYTAKIVDFGLAELIEDGTGGKTEIWGTPYYVSPERLNHEPEDFRSDLYSLGGTLFHALAGRPPFEAENASLVALKHVRSKAVSLQAFAPDISSETSYVINRMLKKDPNERYASYEELVEHLTYAKTKLEERVAMPHKQKERVVVEDDKVKNVMGWITLASILLVIGLFVVAILNWDRIVNAGEEKTDSAERPRRSADVSPDAAFQNARKLFFEEKYEEAAQQLAALSQDSLVAQPLRNWIQMQHGVALLALGKMEESRKVFAEIHARGMYSMDPAHMDLANFFMETSRLLSDEHPISRSTARLYSNRDIEALSIYLFALKNYQLGQMEDAAPLFQTFISSRTTEPWKWIEEYKPIAKKHFTELQTFYRVFNAVDRASTARQIEEAKKRLNESEKELEANPKLQPALKRVRERLEQNLRGIVPSPTPTPASTPTAQAREQEQKQLKAEAEQWTTLRDDTEGLIKNWQFSEAKILLSKFNPTSPDLIKKKSALVYKVEQLEEFQRLLIASVHGEKYPASLRSRTGVRLPEGANKADATKLEVDVQYGTMPLAWKDLSLASMKELIAFYRTRESDAQKQLKWQWLTGIFLNQFDSKNEARELLMEVARQKPEYRDALEMIYSPQ